MCKSIYTTQNYNKIKKKLKKYKKKNFPRKTYYLRKFRARKPYLQKEKHVRKKRPNRKYTNKNCYACGEPDHLATNCPRRKNPYNRQSQLVETVNEDLIEVDEHMSNTESIIV
mgnify:CR=1 FL=1